MFLNPNIFSNVNYNCSNSLDMRNLQEQVKKAFRYQTLFWSFTVWINCSSDLTVFANSLPSALNFKKFSRSLEHFFLTVGQNNFGNKIPFLTCFCTFLHPNYLFQVAIVSLYMDGETSINKLKNNSVSKNSSDLSMFE